MKNKTRPLVRICRRTTFVLASLVPLTGFAAAAAAPAPPASMAPSTFLSSLGPARQLASTVPVNGDVNPYGITAVPASGGKLVKGDILVDNFNDKANVQGTGTTIVQVSPGGTQALFARLGHLPSALSCPGGIGLTTALAVLPGGWVVVGSLPAAPSGAPTGANPAGCLIVLDSDGRRSKPGRAQGSTGHGT